MKRHIILFWTAFTIAVLPACDKFLDRVPESSVTPSAFFSAEEDLAAYTINLYGSFNSISPGSYGIGTFGNDNGTDNQASMGYSSRWVPGEWSVGSGSWSFSTIRDCNYFFDQVLPRFGNGAVSGSETNIRHYIGEMHVIRALAYFDKLQTIGDCPIFDTALPDDEAVLMEASRRRPRHEVARFILSDLEQAEQLLMASGTPSGNKNRISRDVALLLHSRVALYEGTWLKHHKGTAFVPGGPGWPGDAADLKGFDIDAEIDWFLTQAIKASKAVGDKYCDRLTENTGTREGMDAKLSVLNPYYVMFCDTDMEKYAEVLMWRRFHKGLNVTHNIQMQLGRNGGGTGWTLGLVNSFLTENGLPIYADPDYNPEWELEGVEATLRNRDSRIRIFTKQDGDVDYYMGGNPTYSYYHWILDGQSETRMVTGFPLKKGKHYDGSLGADGTHNNGVTGSIVFRAAEALLNYIEAYYEKNGTLADNTLETYWHALRTRARIDPDYHKTIAATDVSKEAEGDWGAYSKGQLVDATLYNIRRERRNELIGESLRMMDLKRWRALDQMVEKPYIIRGMRYWGSRYDTEGIWSEPNDAGESFRIPVIVDVEGGTGNISAGVKDGGIDDYIRPYQISRVNNSVFDGYRFTPAHYLNPIGQATFRKTAVNKGDLETSVVYQNPGWSRVAGEKPVPVK